MKTLSIAEAANLLQAGGVVVFPTETVYGLGADALNKQAVERVYRIKQRPPQHPLIIHSYQPQQLDRVCMWNEQARALAETFWPGPLTLVLPKHPGFASHATGGLATVGVRVPSHPIARQLLEQCGRLVAAPSANLFTRLSPTRSSHAQLQLADQVDGYVEGGPCESGLESTIVGWHHGKPTLLRHGALAEDALQQVVGELAGWEGTQVVAPGQHPKHYAPTTRLVLRGADELTDALPIGRIGLLSFGPLVCDTSPFAVVRNLSVKADSDEAARELFAALHELQTHELDAIVAQRLPSVGLGKSVNDRLMRAAWNESDQPIRSSVAAN